jgi:hypothetical protein
MGVRALAAKPADTGKASVAGRARIAVVAGRAVGLGFVLARAGLLKRGCMNRPCTRLLSNITIAVPSQFPPLQASPVCARVTVVAHVDVPFAELGFEQTPVPVLQVPMSWHWSSAVQTTGLPPLQAPDWQVSVCVHASPSLQAVPFALTGFEQTPVPVLQVPASWHWSSAVHTTGFAPVHAPD